MVTIISPDVQPFSVSQATIWTFIAIFIAVTITFYVLRSIGFYVMAKKREIKHAFIAFIPLVWIFIACKLVGKVNILGSTFQKLALVFCIIFAVGSSLNFIYLFIIYFPVAGNFLAGNELCLVLVTDSALIKEVTSGLEPIWDKFYIYIVKNAGLTGGLTYQELGISSYALDIILDVLSIVTNILVLAISILTVLLYVNLFKRYYPEHFILFSVLSWMGIFAPLVFALRKREPVNYNDYLRERYNAWYAGGNPYGGQYQNRPPETPPTPFTEFAEKDEIDPGDPFSGFNNNKNKSGEDNDKDEFFE